MLATRGDVTTGWPPHTTNLFSHRDSHHVVYLLQREQQFLSPLDCMNLNVGTATESSPLLPV